MAKLVSPKAELVVLRGMCSKNKKVAGTLISSVDERYFYSDESLELFKAIRKHMKDTGVAPSYRLLIEDPDISEDARSFMRDSEATIQSVEEARKATKILNTYRQRRDLFNLAASINDKMKKSKVDTDSLLEEAATTVNIARSMKSTENSFLHFGKTSNNKEVIQDILYGEDEDDIIPTGIEPFDQESGGLSRGSLVTIGANSGAGKSLMANALAINIARRGYKVVVVPLEMSKKEMSMRLLANVTKTDFSDLRLRKLATGERKKVDKIYQRWEKKVKKNGGRYTLFKPEEDMTIEEIMSAISAYDSDVVLIDYISLLKGTDGDDMWRALSSVARYGKINAEVDNKVNILLCQVDGDGKIRYSRAISEHSSNSFIWTMTKEEKEEGIATVEQPKSRNSLSFPFKLRFIWKWMRIKPVSMSENLGEIDESSGKGKGKKKKKDRSQVKNLAADI